VNVWHKNYDIFLESFVKEQCCFCSRLIVVEGTKTPAVARGKRSACNENQQLSFTEHFKKERDEKRWI